MGFITSLGNDHSLNSRENTEIGDFDSNIHRCPQVSVSYKAHVSFNFEAIRRHNCGYLELVQISKCYTNSIFTLYPWRHGCNCSRMEQQPKQDLETSALLRFFRSQLVSHCEIRTFLNAQRNGSKSLIPPRISTFKQGSSLVQRLPLLSVSYR